MGKNFVVFTDLDGTLLDKKYSFRKALPALRLLKKKKIPLVISTSKTRAEIEVFRKKLGNTDPFVSENGGAIFIPKNYFSFKYKFDEVKGKYKVIEIGLPTKKVKKKLNAIKKKFSGRIYFLFSEARAKEVARDSGLSVKMALKAKKREYTETFRVEGDRKELKRLARRNGMHFTEGTNYFHLMGDNNKGKAVRILMKLFRKKLGRVSSVGLGDAANDKEMLMEVDKAFLVQKYNKKFFKLKRAKKVRGIASIGWNKAVKELVRENEGKNR